VSRHTESFAKFLGRSPDTATAEDVRRLQVHQTEQGAQPPKMKTQASALQFLFITTIGRVDLAHHHACLNYPRKLQGWLSQGCDPLLPFEQPTDVRVIRAFLGNAKLDTTARYTEVATNLIAIGDSSKLVALWTGRRSPNGRAWAGMCPQPCAVSVAHRHKPARPADIAQARSG